MNSPNCELPRYLSHFCVALSVVLSHTISHLCLIRCFVFYSSCLYIEFLCLTASHADLHPISSCGCPSDTLSLPLLRWSSSNICMFERAQRERERERKGEAERERDRCMEREREIEGGFFISATSYFVLLP